MDNETNTCLYLSLIFLFSLLSSRSSFLGEDTPIALYVEIGDRSARALEIPALRVQSSPVLTKVNEFPRELVKT